jgi:hypothetical protein
MKLAKKNNVPVLSFEIFGTTHMGRRVKVAHDVRIEVMKPTDVALLTEPRCPEPDVRPFRFFYSRGRNKCTPRQGFPTLGPDHAPAAHQDTRRRRAYAEPFRRNCSACQLVRLPSTLRQHRGRQGGHNVERLLTSPDE